MLSLASARVNQYFKASKVEELDRQSLYAAFNETKKTVSLTYVAAGDGL